MLGLQRRESSRLRRRKEWGPLIALADLMLASQWHIEQRIEERLDALEQRVNGLAEGIARVGWRLGSRAALPLPKSPWRAEGQGQR